MSTHAQPPNGDRGPVPWIRRLPSWTLLAVGALVVALLIPASIWLTSHDNAASDSAAASSSALSTVKSQAAPLAGNVSSLCSAGGSVASALASAGACTQAQKVASVVAVPGPSGPAGPSGPPGANGSNGLPSRGIASTRILGGDLLITYTDGSTLDVGTVTGPSGHDGRGVSGSAIVGDDLVISYTDGSSKDLGAVVGPAGHDGASGVNGINGQNGTNGVNGCGISSVSEQSGNLVVTYDADCATPGPAVVGPIPQAQACPDGSAPSTTQIVEPSGLAGSTTVNGVLVCG